MGAGVARIFVFIKYGIYQAAQQAGPAVVSGRRDGLHGSGGIYRRRVLGRYRHRTADRHGIGGPRTLHIGFNIAGQHIACQQTAGRHTRGVDQGGGRGSSIVTDGRIQFRLRNGRQRQVARHIQRRVLYIGLYLGGLICAEART